MKKSRENRTIERIIFDTNLLRILSDGHHLRLSRFDAFMWLMENIRIGHVSYDVFGIKSWRQELVTTNSKIAETWHWSRPLVLDFIQQLIDLSVICQTRSGHKVIYSINPSFEDNIIFSL